MSDQDASEQSQVKAATAPDPDDPRKPDSPADLSRPTRKFILKNTVREFLDDECTDVAAGLTYYAVLSLFPAILALVASRWSSDFCWPSGPRRATSTRSAAR